MRKSRWVMSTALICALLWYSNEKQAFAAPAPDDHSVLILGSTVSGGAASLEVAKATALGYTTVVASDADWAAMSVSDFDSYRSFVFGDATCPGIGTSPWLDAALANRTAWSSVVDGNIIVIGTDPVYHQGQGGAQLVESGISFATNIAGKTGLYADLSCYYHDTAPGTPIPLLDQFGLFSATGVGCYNDVHIVAVHPALAGTTDTTLSYWYCSIHEALDSYPEDFLPLAIANNAGTPDQQKCFADNTCGIPYIIARGETLSPIRCGDGKLDETEECDDGNVVNGDGCNAQCKIEYCGDGVVNNSGTEECDDGNNLDGDGCSANCTLEVARECEADVNCDDANACTIDRCIDFKCEHNAIICDDGDACNGKELCDPDLGCAAGEPLDCDDHNDCTSDLCDEARGCVNVVTVESRACNTCNDLVDNDDDGNIDCEDDDCSTFSDMCRFAVLGIRESGNSVTMGRAADVLAGSVCSNNDLGVRKEVKVGGSVAVGGNSKFASGESPTTIDAYFASDGGTESLSGLTVPIVGPFLQTLTDPANVYADRTGTQENFSRCMDAVSALTGDAAVADGLPSSMSLGAVTLPVGSPPMVVSLGSGVQVVDVDSLKMGLNTQLVLDGAADTVAVIRVAGKFKVGSKAKILLGGALTADRVLLDAEGTRGSVKLGALSEVSGTVVAAGRRKIKAGAFSTVHGALFGQKVLMKRQATVDHVAFTPLL